MSDIDWYYASKDYDIPLREERVKRLSFFKKKKMNLGGVIVKNSAYVPIQMHESILKGL